MGKYNNKRTVIDGYVFDSVAEARRYRELKLLEKAGEISELELQKRIELIPAQHETIDTGEVYKVGIRRGMPKVKRVCVEASVVYVADFCYKNKDGETVYEDVKGMHRAPKEYVIKRKLALYLKGIRIKEVRYGKN